MSTDRILVIRAGAVGDFILTLPLFTALRAAHPGAAIEVLGYPSIAELAVGRRLADSAARVDSMEYASLFAPGVEPDPGLRRYLDAFDQVVCVWPDRDGVMGSNLRRAGVQCPVMIDPLPPEGGGVHAVDCLLTQMGQAGIEPCGRAPRIFLSERDRWWAERLMRVTGAGYRPLLGLHAGSGSPRKNWPRERFLEVARAWALRRGGGVLLTQGPAEPDLDDLAASISEDRCWVLGDEPLSHVAAALERCRAYVGNDSGITHLAAAVGVPTVAVFGPTDPRVWAPLGRRVVVVSPPPHEAFPGADAVQRSLESVERMP